MPSSVPLAVLALCLVLLLSLGSAEPSRPEWKTSFSVQYAGWSRDNSVNVTHTGHMMFHSEKNRVRVNNQASDGTSAVSIFDFGGSQAYLFTGVSQGAAACANVKDFDTRKHPSPFRFPCDQPQTKFLGAFMRDGTVTYAWSNCKMHLSYRVTTPSEDMYTLHVDAFTGAPAYAYNEFETFTFSGYQEIAIPVDSYFYVPQEFEGSDGVCNGGKLIQPMQWWPLVLILVIFLIFVCCVVSVLSTVIFIFRFHIKSLFTGEPLPDNAITFDKIKGVIRKRGYDEQEEEHEGPTL